jgi:hypothetical protein
MHLRKFVLVKYLVILLFAFELLAPAFLDEALSLLDNFGSSLSLQKATNQIDVLGILFIEESGSAERNEKNGIDTAHCTETFSALMQFKPCSITWLLPNKKNNSQPSLYTLHRVLRI